MKVNASFINVPPYLSTHWSQVASIYQKDSALFFQLKNGEQVSIPDLSNEAIDSIFTAHAAYLTKEPGRMGSLQKQEALDPSFKVSFSSLDQAGAAFGMALQHDPSQKDAPDLPEELLSKIKEVGNTIFQGQLGQIEQIDGPKPEHGCNCPFCQIARVINPLNSHENDDDDEVLDDDLKFDEWKIEQVDENLYNVTNKLDTFESYRVFLGEPVGCNCGKSGCDHILAVLKS